MDMRTSLKCLNMFFDIFASDEETLTLGGLGLLCSQKRFHLQIWVLPFKVKKTVLPKDTSYHFTLSSYHTCWDLQDPLFQVVSIHFGRAGLAKNTTTGNLEPVVLLITSSKTVFAALMASSHHDSLKLFTRCIH